eukprot:923263_1
MHETNGLELILVVHGILFGAGEPDGNINPPDPNKHFKLETAEVALFDRETWDTYFDVKTVFEMAEEIPKDDNLGYRTLRTANEIANILNGDDRSTWASARALASPVLSARNGPTQHRVTAVGHCHIDTAWLWPYAETRRKTARSWASQLEYMKRYPGYKFVASQAQQFSWLKEDYPELFARIQKHIRAGSGGFRHVGGTWVEMDTNVPAGESLVRQFLLG